MTEPKMMPLTHATASGEQPAYAPAVSKNSSENGPVAPAGSTAESVGKWVHQNKWFTKEPISFIGYQGVRAALASIPYGFGMAAVHHGMGWLNVTGQRMGYTAQGVAKAGNSALFGRNLSRAASSPLNAALQIGLAFSMFRSVGGIVKTLRDQVTDPDASEAEKIQRVHHTGHIVSDAAHRLVPAEFASVPIAAFALGFIGANFKPTEKYVKGPGESFGKAVKRVWSPKSNLLQNAAIWTVSYSIFFEMAERIAKDYQIKHGTWKGYPNSLAKKPDSITGHPPGDIHINPDGSPGVTADNNTTGVSQPKEHSLGADPGIARFVFRRVVPVALGISAYAMLKRAGYVAVGGPMTPITEDVLKGKNVKTFLGNAWREGAATSMFFVLWTFTDSMGSMFDKYFGEQVKPDPTIQKNHDALLAKLNAKEHGFARAS